MKSVIRVIAMATLVVAPLACKQQQSHSPQVTAEPSVGNTQVANDLVTALAAGDITAATSQFDSTMKAAMSPDMLAGVWDGVVQQFGPFIEQQNTREENVGGFNVAFVTCKFERGILTVQVTMNADGLVGGLFIRPAG